MWDKLGSVYFLTTFWLNFGCVKIPFLGWCQSAKLLETGTIWHHQFLTFLFDVSPWLQIEQLRYVKPIPIKGAGADSALLLLLEPLIFHTFRRTCVMLYEQKESHSVKLIIHNRAENSTLRTHTNRDNYYLSCQP